jgi:CheY-like chemotaxis protein
MLSRKPSIPQPNSPKPSDESDRVIASQRLVAAASGLAEKQFDADNSQPTKALASPSKETKDSSQDGTKVNSTDAKVTTQPATKEDVNPETKDDRMHVLVVEDNLVNQRVLFKQLVKAGCVVHTADNGLLALRHLETTQFRATDGIPLSIILIDCEMPEMDGLTCCRKIRDMERSGVVKEHVPIIAVTANIRGGQLDEATESGMDDVVGKPFRIPDLLGKMKGLLERLGEGVSKAD